MLHIPKNNHQTDHVGPINGQQEQHIGKDHDGWITCEMDHVHAQWYAVAIIM